MGASGLQGERPAGLDPATIARLPKVALHDHLDGGLRAATVAELAADVGHELPAPAEGLGDWFFDAADSGSLVRYLTTFDHTIAVMQSADHLRRIAREWVEDLAADGVVHGEARWAPEQHTRQGLSLAEAVEAVGLGLADGMAGAAACGRPFVARQLVTSLRHTAPNPEVVDLAVAGEHLVAGFDLAGPEDGYGPELHAASFARLRETFTPFTVHAGEAAGVASLDGAIQVGALRLGHGVRIIEDITRDASGYRLGPVARWVLDRRIPLEVSPSSNLQTGICGTIAEHPFGLLERLGFVVTINCDNRLMSRTSYTRETQLLVEAFGYGPADLERFTTDAVRAAFLPHEERERIVAEVVRPAFA